MRSFKEIYTYIVIGVFIIFAVLLNFNILTIITAILGGVILSSLESMIFFDIEQKPLTNIIVALVLFPINMVLAYRIFCEKNYNISWDYVIFFFIVSFSIGIKLIRDKIKGKTDKEKEISKKEKFKKWFKSTIVTLGVLELMVPMIWNQYEYKEIDFNEISVYDVKHNGNKIDFERAGVQKTIENHMKSLGNVKRSTTIEQLNLMKERAIEGEKNYNVGCWVGYQGDGEIIFLKDNKVFMKLRKKHVFFEGKFGLRYDYYILNLSDNIKNELNEFFKVNPNK